MTHTFWGGNMRHKVEKHFSIGEEIPRVGDGVTHPDNPEIIGIVARVFSQRRESGCIKVVYEIATD